MSIMFKYCMTLPNNLLNQFSFKRAAVCLAGIYGVPGHVKRKAHYKPTEAMRIMEEFTRRVGGVAFLYADIFMTRTEFEDMFDLELYTDMRKKFGAETAFPHLYDKVKPEIDLMHLDDK